CFTPADDPEIILLVLADMPNGQIDYYGSKVAVPCARDILTEVLPYMGISPQYSESELANLDVKVPLLEGSFENAKTELMSIGLEPQRVGDGATVVAQCPEPGETVAKGGTVYLYTVPTHTADFTTVPDLRGLDPQVANDSLIYCNLNYVSRGASIDHPGAVVNSQSIEPNTKVPNGTVIELEFIVDDPGD
ncbi:MAG TPA: PASTA domain-containing protein, partial [Ruminococcus flavefaciens]|nr:PASTA domain-containing protein [Ruminococcus flavefaciens]